MKTAPRSPSRQGALILAKINASARRAAAKDQELALARTSLCDAFSAYFAEQAANADLSKRSATSKQIAAMSGAAGSWFIFADHGNEIIVGLSDDLVLAAADFALCQKITSGADAKPTPIDRSIAAALAGRLAGAALGAATAERENAPALRRIGETLQQLSLPPAPHGWTMLTLVGAVQPGGAAFTVMIGRPVAAPDEKQSPPAVAGPALSQRMRAININARCILGAIETPLRRALDLKRGDILPLDWRGTDDLPLIASGKTIAAGTLGEHHGRRAIRIANFRGDAKEID